MYSSTPGEGLIYLAIFIGIGIGMVWVTAYVAARGVLAAIRKDRSNQSKPVPARKSPSKPVIKQPTN